MFDLRKPFIEQLAAMAQQLNETRPELRHERVEEEDMAKSKTTSKNQKAPLYTWAFQSTDAQVGGTRVTYVTQLNTNEKLSCNCPGWIFSPTKGGTQEKACKHTRDVIAEVPVIMKAFKEGRTLPTIVQGDNGFSTHANAHAQEANVSSIKFGRVIDF